MKHKPYKYPLILESLMAAGVGRRKARRMIKHAVFVGHKTCNVSFKEDHPSLYSFCIWSHQGKYRNSWMVAANA